jgi:hypothetical protein
MTPELHGGLCLACTVASAFITWLRLDTTYAHHDTTTLNVGGRLPLCVVFAFCVSHWRMWLESSGCDACGVADAGAVVSQSSQKKKLSQSHCHVGLRSSIMANGVSLLTGPH